MQTTLKIARSTWKAEDDDREASLRTAKTSQKLDAVLQTNGHGSSEAPPNPMVRHGLQRPMAQESNEQDKDYKRDGGFEVVRDPETSEWDRQAEARKDGYLGKYQ